MKSLFVTDRPVGLPIHNVMCNEDIEIRERRKRMKFNIEITTDSKDSNIKDKCLSAVSEVLEKDGKYFGAGFATEEPSFRELAMPLVEYLRKGYHPHTRIIIEYDGAEVVEGVLGEPYKERKDKHQNKQKQ